MPICSHAPTHAVAAREYWTGLLAHGLRPIIVFDGQRPTAKLAEGQRRDARKLAAMTHVIEAKQADSAATEQQLKTAAISGVTDALVGRCIAALRRAGVPYVVAPFEADAQLALLSRLGLVFAVITPDGDAIVLQCERIVRRFDARTGIAEVYTMDAIKGGPPSCKGKHNKSCACSPLMMAYRRNVRKAPAHLNPALFIYFLWK